MIQRMVELEAVEPAVYEPGDFVRFYGQYFNKYGLPDDPRLVVLHLTDVCGKLTIYTCPGPVHKCQKGVYCFDMIAGMIGQGLYRWLSSDGMIALPHLSVRFEVRESRW